MDYVSPTEVVAEACSAAEKKAGLPVRDMLVRGFLAGALLGIATSLAAVIVAQGLPPFLGAAAFPVGFAILVLLGLELDTGNFALLPMGMAAGRVRLWAMLRNWWWVYIGNLVGALFYAFLFYLSFTEFGNHRDGAAVGEAIRQMAEKKTLAYIALGPTANGWALALVKGVLANWMVTVGTAMAFVSRSTIGKVAAMWLPIMTFFAHGYEHSIVNMFVIPAGMLFGSPISLGDWWAWNQVPATLGNIIGGALLTGLSLYVTHRPTAS